MDERMLFFVKIKSKPVRLEVINSKLELKGQKQSNRVTHFVRARMHNNQRSLGHSHNNMMNELTAKTLKCQAESEFVKKRINAFAYIIGTL